MFYYMNFYSFIILMELITWGKQRFFGLFNWRNLLWKTLHQRVSLLGSMYNPFRNLEMLTIQRTPVVSEGVECKNTFCNRPIILKGFSDFWMFPIEPYNYQDTSSTALRTKEPWTIQRTQEESFFYLRG